MKFIYHTSKTISTRVPSVLIFRNGLAVCRPDEQVRDFGTNFTDDKSGELRSIKMARGSETAVLFVGRTRPRTQPCRGEKSDDGKTSEKRASGTRLGGRARAASRSALGRRP